MRSKRLLTLILALCMMLSVVSPAASAVNVGEDSYLSTSRNPETSATDTSGTDAAPQGALNLRDNPIDRPEQEETEETESEGT